MISGSQAGSAKGMSYLPAISPTSAEIAVALLTALTKPKSR